MVKQKKIPDGYKMSEVGVIPCEWEVKTFGELFDIYGGYSASRDQLSDKGYCYLHYGDIHKSNKTFIDVKNEFRILPKLNIPIKKISKNSLLKDGDVVFVDASEDDEGTSKHIVIRNSENIEYISGLHTIVARSKDEILSNLYKQFCFKTDDIKKQFKFYAAGTKVSGISKGNISKIYLPIPLKKEQKAIATALSDIDDLILSMQKLIDKKKLIKQGTMQELLSGKKRLDGFEGEWKNKKISDILYVFNGGTPNTLNSNYWNGNIKWCTPTDITKCTSKYLYDTQKKITIEGLKASSARLLPKGSILLCSRATIGEARIAGNEITTNQGFKSLICKEYIDNEFIYYYITILKNVLIEKAIGSTFLEISKKDINEIIIYLPEYKEQKAIAKILSDMDQEIEKLEIKLDKYKQIKKGMMEELLTGKRRVI